MAEEKRQRTRFAAPRGTVWMLAPEDLVIIGRDTPDGPEHPLYDAGCEDPPDPADVESLIAVGQIAPVLVKKLPIDGVERAAVVDGRHRVIAMRQLNRERRGRGEEPVLCRAEEHRGSMERIEAVVASANWRRRTYSTLEKARLAARLVERGFSVREVASMAAVSDVAVRQWLRLLEVGPDVQRAVEHDQISASAAAKLAALPPDEQKKTLAELLGAAGVKRPTVKSAGRESAKRSGRSDSGATRPGVRAITRLYSLARSKESGASDEELALLGFVLGELDEARLQRTCAWARSPR